MKRIWKAKMNCIMPWRDFTKGETCELDDSEVTPRVKALFECLNQEEKKETAEDSDLKIMVERLKAAKVPIKKGYSADKIRELFNEFLGKGATAGAVSGEAEGGSQQEPPKEEEPPKEDK